MKELVSIIIPVFNMEDSLESSVGAILKQDYSNFEIILVDDGSKDNSFKICQKICAMDSRVVCVHTENQGSGPARNVGIANSRGKYLYFPDADDYLKPNTISRLVEEMQGGKYDLIIFGYQWSTRSGKIIFEKQYDRFENSGDIIRNNYKQYFEMNDEYSIQGAPWNKFFKSTVVKSNGVKYPPLRRHQDEGFISRYMTYAQNVKFIPDILYTYYPNTVSLEWKKYPIDYIDSVLGLKQIWQDTIFKWNPEDKKTHFAANREIFEKIINALELVYSPKEKLKGVYKVKRVKELCKISNISEYKFEIVGSTYQKGILFCAKSRAYTILTFLLYLGSVKNRIRQGG